MKGWFKNSATMYYDVEAWTINILSIYAQQICG